MDLILWRHADAVSGEPDLDRRLTANGVERAARMAAWLERYLPDRCRILVSPARRAQQTAQALRRKFKTVDDLAPGASVAAALAAADWPKSRECVMIVGHQPTLGEVASLLLSGAEAEWSMKKGGVWWLTDRERDGSSSIVLRVAIDPDFV